MAKRGRPLGSKNTKKRKYDKAHNEPANIVPFVTQSPEMQKESPRKRIDVVLSHEAEWLERVEHVMMTTDSAIAVGTLYKVLQEERRAAMKEPDKAIKVAFAETSETEANAG